LKEGKTMHHMPIEEQARMEGLPYWEVVVERVEEPQFVAHEGTDRERAHAHFREWMKEVNIARVELRVNGKLHTLYKDEDAEMTDLDNQPFLGENKG
jgi:hypothetical protein